MFIAALVALWSFCSRVLIFVTRTLFSIDFLFAHDLLLSFFLLSGGVLFRTPFARGSCSFSSTRCRSIMIVIHVGV